MLRYTTLLAILSLLPFLAQADVMGGISLPMWQQGSGGFYVRGVFAGGIESELLVDTGSSYVVLSGDTFARLKRSGATAFQRTIRGTTAAGRSMEAKVYSVSELALGATCVLRDIEAVVLRNADRDILGLSALRRLQPFSLNFEPAALTVSECKPFSDLALVATSAAK
jgi:clan AA aspartic protease (TIGR02281 family)